ncbi:MAG: hypothetical protein NTU95_05350 [Methanothrix sp.]|nr:hypothetical protein [Methanothrix sp.]
MAFLILWILLSIALISMPVSGIMKFEFSCTGEGATISTYSYLKEPTLDYSGYTRGMKTGSMNYLENGTISQFNEKYRYTYGNATPKANSSLTHTMDIKFDGVKGISEFFGQGFFKNNRALSAWKKIRYDIVRYPVKDPQGKLILSTRTARNISVTAALTMDMTPGAFYDMDYTAKALDAVIETRDQTRYTNVSKAAGIDWEHETLSRGDVLNITNKLFDSQLYYTLAGPGDWLPCCMSGTLPPVENEYSPAMLYPQKIMPNNQSCIECRKECLKECRYTFKLDNCTPISGGVKKANCGQTGETECISKCDNKCSERCQDGACDGFECIYTYQNSSLATAGGLIFKSPAQLWIDGLMNESDPMDNITFYTNQAGEEARHVFYILTVKNSGGQVLTDIEIVIRLDKSVKPADKVLSEYGVTYNPDAETELVEKTFDLSGGATKTIEIEAYARGTIDDPSNGISINAKGHRLDGTEVPLYNEFKVGAIPRISSGTDISV